ncbi:MAG: helicase-related protein [Coriobacteriia bacterium]
MHPALASALEGHVRAIEEDRNLLGFSADADGCARQLVDWLRSQLPDGTARVEVKRFTNGFMHGKCFVLEVPVGKGVLAGSSNFTYAGLAENRELNLGQYEPETVDTVLDWFDELWKQSEDYDLAALYEARWQPHEPRLIFYRMLWELYGRDVLQEIEERDASDLNLTNFQRDGVWRARRILEALSGVVVADEVGLGKTYIAAEIIHDAIVKNRQKVLVVCPAALRQMWEEFLRAHNLMTPVVSYDQLVHHESTAGTSGSPLEDLDAYAVVIVDEAHALRNPATARADAMRALLEGQSPKKLVLMTATPVNNSLTDIYTLISYFVTNDAAFADSGILSLKGYFDAAQGRNPDDLSPEHLFDVMDKIAVRRTREFVKEHYQGDRILYNGEWREIRFPKPRVRRVDYSLEDVLPGFFGELAYALGAESGESDTVILDDLGQVLTFARYVPSHFLRPNVVQPRLETGEEWEGEQYERQNAGLLRSGLLKRFESSGYAFQRTIDKMMGSHDIFLAALDSGWVITGDALREWMASDSDDMDTFIDSLDEALAERHVASVADYDVEALRTAVEADRALLGELGAKAKVADCANDPKIDALVEQLVSIIEQADKDGATEQLRRDNRKVLVFSYFADTVEYLEGELRRVINHDERLAAYRGRIATATGSDKGRQAAVIAGFAPRTAGSENDEDLYDLVITTDVLAEGVNLQQARHIINYDLPWNPMRLVQRYGRIDRIGSDHAEVFIRVFFPTAELDEMLSLEDRLQRKIKRAAAAVGVREVLPGVTEVQVNLTESRDEIERLKAEDASLFENGGASALSGEAYRRRLEDFIKQPGNRELLESLPWGVGAAFQKRGVTEPAIVFCANIAGSEEPWFRYVPLDDSLAVQTEEDLDTGMVRVKVSSEILACLSRSDTGDAEPHPENIINDEIYAAAFSAWEVAQRDIVDRWNYLTDPANLRPKTPAAMRDAVQHVRAYGGHLGDRADRLVDKLDAPHSPRIQRAVRAALAAADLSDRQKVDALEDLAKRMNLQPYAAPEPRDPITDEDVHVVAWSAILPKPE